MVKVSPVFTQSKQLEEELERFRYGETDLNASKEDLLPLMSYTERMRVKLSNSETYRHILGWFSLLSVGGFVVSCLMWVVGVHTLVDKEDLKIATLFFFVLLVVRILMYSFLNVGDDPVVFKK